VRDGELAVESLRQQSVLHELEVADERHFPPDLVHDVPPEKKPSRGYIANLQLLWDHRATIGRVAVWALLLSTAIAFLIPRKYDSTVRIMPPDTQGDTGMMLAALSAKTGLAPGGLASLAGSMLGMKNTGALFVDLLQSRTVQNKIVDRFHLQKVYWERYKQDAREVLGNRTDVKEDRKSGVIIIVVRDRSPERARDMAQAYVDELDRLVAQVSTSAARRERIFIEQRLLGVRRDLEDAEQRFSNFASKNTTLDIKEQTRAMVGSAAMLQGEVIAAQSEVQSLQQIYTPNNVRVRAAEARIYELKRQLQKLGGTDESLGLGSSSSKDDLYPSLRKLPLLGVEWADLYRATKIQETLFEHLTQQYEMAKIQEAKEIPVVRVVDPANLPEKKTFPPRLLIVSLLTCLSVFGAGAWIIWNYTLHTFATDDPRRKMAAQVGEALGELRKRVKTYSLFRRDNNLNGSEHNGN
jgi:capsule polysaccharide export protein KpsE/RkpR